MQFHNRQVAELFDREKKLDRERNELRGHLDRALRAARVDGVPHKLLAIGIVEKLGLEPSLEECERTELLLRQRTVVAARRVRMPNGAPVAIADRVGQGEASPIAEVDMNENENEPYIKSKTVTVTETRTEYAAPEFFDEVEEPEVSGEDHLGRVALMGSDNASAPNPARPRRR